MSDRAHMDKPAAAIAVVAGVLLIAASLPFAIMALPQKPTEYLVFWEKEEAGRVPLSAAGDQGTQSVKLTVAGHLANVTVSLGAGACADTFDPEAPHGQKPVTVTWRLTSTENGNSTEGKFTCAEVAAGRESTPPGHPSPDLGSLKATNRTEAERVFGAKTDGQRDNVTYTLEVTWSRAAATPTLDLPTLPGVTPTTEFRVTLNLAASEWTARIEEKPEAGK